MKCSSCGAPIEVGLTKCPYCSSSVSQYANLEIQDFILFLESELKSISQNKYNMKVFISFAVLSSFWLYLSWLTYQKSPWINFLFTLVGLGFIFFVTWGFIIKYYENKALK